MREAPQVAQVELTSGPLPLALPCCSCPVSLLRTYGHLFTPGPLPHRPAAGPSRQAQPAGGRNACGSPWTMTCSRRCWILRCVSRRRSCHSLHSRRLSKSSLDGSHPVRRLTVSSFRHPLGRWCRTMEARWQQQWRRRRRPPVCSRQVGAPTCLLRLSLHKGGALWCLAMVTADGNSSSALGMARCRCARRALPLRAHLTAPGKAHMLLLSCCEQTAATITQASDSLLPSPSVAYLSFLHV